MKYICFIAMIFIGLFTQNAWADNNSSDNLLDKRFVVYGGAQRYEAKGDFSSTREGRRKVTIDLNDLGLDEDETSPILGLRYKISKRWTFRFDYFGYHEEERRSADFRFNFDDLNVPVGARLDTDLDLDIYVANISYDIIHTPKARLGAGIGAHVADIDLEITAKLRLGERDVPLGDGDEELLAPLPNLYAYGSYLLEDNLLIRVGGGWISLSYEDYDGELIFASAFLEYWPFRHAGFGLGYRYVEADIEYDPGNKVEEYDVQLPGPMVYVVFGF